MTPFSEAPKRYWLNCVYRYVPFDYTDTQTTTHKHDILKNNIFIYIISAPDNYLLVGVRYCHILETGSTDPKFFLFGSTTTAE